MDLEEIPTVGWLYNDGTKWKRANIEVKGTFYLNQDFKNSMKIVLIIAAFPTSVIVSSEGSVLEKYPDCLGEYQLLQDTTHPVYKSLVTANRYILHSGQN